MGTLQHAGSPQRAESGRGGGPDDGYPPGREAFRELLDGVNINHRTLLATDFLNNFNELMMLVEMLPSDPDLIGEIEEWQALDYPDHFARSGFPHPKLAVAGWRRADPKLRSSISRFVGTTRDQLPGMIEELKGALASGDPAETARACEHIGQTLAIAHDWVSALIQGRDALDEDEIERLLGRLVRGGGEAANASKKSRM